MIIKKIVEYLVGYIDFEIKGTDTEVFLEECSKNNINLYNIRVLKNTTEMKTSVKDYKKIQKIKIKGLKRKILKKWGIRFPLHKHRKRTGFAIGFLLMIFLLIFLSGFIWKIEISGNTKISDNLLIQTLKNYGVFEGAKKSKLNITQIENKIKNDLYDLSWITINFDGSIASVEIKERYVKPVSEDRSRPSNLIAQMDGQIVKMEITKGKPMVSVGDAVVKGNLLVAGFYNDKKDNIILEHSSGRVTAEVSVSKTFSAKIKSSRIIGKEVVSKYSIDFFGKVLDINRKSEFEKEWQQTVNKTQLSVFGLKFPIYFIENCFTRNITEDYNLSDKKIKENIKMEIDHFEKSEFFDSKIINKRTVWRKDNDGYSAIVDYVVHKNIAEQQYIESDR